MAEEIKVIRIVNGSRPVDAQEKERWVLTEEGKEYASSNSPEVQIFLAIPPEGVPPAKLEKVLSLDKEAYQAGFAAALKNGWIEPGKQLLTRKVESVEDVVKDLLQRVQGGEVPEEIDDLEKRKLVKSKPVKTKLVTGSQFYRC